MGDSSFNELIHSNVNKINHRPPFFFGCKLKWMTCAERYYKLLHFSFMVYGCRTQNMCFKVHYHCQCCYRWRRNHHLQVSQDVEFRFNNLDSSIWTCGNFATINLDSSQDVGTMLHGSGRSHVKPDRRFAVHVALV